MEKARKSRVKKEDIDYNYNSAFPVRLRGLLEKTTQDELAKACGVARQSVAQWKDGNTKPDIYYLGKIADFFNVSTDYLLGKDECTTPNNEAIKKLLGLNEMAIKMLENSNSSEDVRDIQAKKIAMINYLIENMNSTEHKLLENLYNYLFLGFGFPIPNDNEKVALATEICYGNGTGKIVHTYLNANDINSIYLSKTQEDIVKMQNEYRKQEVAKNDKKEGETV